MLYLLDEALHHVVEGNSEWNLFQSPTKKKNVWSGRDSAPPAASQFSFLFERWRDVPLGNLLRRHNKKIEKPVIASGRPQLRYSLSLSWGSKKGRKRKTDNGGHCCLSLVWLWNQLIVVAWNGGRETETPEQSVERGGGLGDAIDADVSAIVEEEEEENADEPDGRRTEPFGEFFAKHPSGGGGGVFRLVCRRDIARRRRLPGRWPEDGRA